MESHLPRNTSLAHSKAKNLCAILGRLARVRNDRNLAKAIIGEFQGVFLRRHGTQLEMYCYDTHTQKLSELMSSVDVTAPLTLVNPYEQAMTLAAFWQSQPPKTLYFAGVGGGRLATYMQHHFRECIFDGSDIDPNMLHVATEWFGFAPCARFDIATEDARKDLGSRTKKYCAILLDVYFGGGEAADHLGTEEFFDLCRHKVSDDGVVVANFIEQDPLHLRKIAGLRNCFEYCAAWDFIGTRMVFASNRPFDLESIRSRVAAFEAENGSDSSVLEQACRLTPMEAQITVSQLSDRELNWVNNFEPHEAA